MLLPSGPIYIHIYCDVLAVLGPSWLPLIKISALKQQGLLLCRFWVSLTLYLD